MTTLAQLHGQYRMAWTWRNGLTAGRHDAALCLLRLPAVGNGATLAPLLFSVLGMAGARHGATARGCHPGTPHTAVWDGLQATQRLGIGKDATTVWWRVERLKVLPAKARGLLRRRARRCTFFVQALQTYS